MKTSPGEQLAVQWPAMCNVESRHSCSHACASMMPWIRNPGFETLDLRTRSLRDAQAVAQAG